MTTPTTTSYAPPSAARPSWRNRSKPGSAFGTNPPDVSIPAELGKAIAALKDRQTALDNLKSDRDELLKSRTVYRNDRQKALDEVVRGIGKDADVPPDKELEFEVALSDLEHQIATATRLIRDADSAILAVAAAHADEIRENSADAVEGARASARKSFGKFAADYAALQEAENMAAWTASVAAGTARPYVPPRASGELAAISAQLEPASARQNEYAKVEEFIDSVGWENVLKPLQVGSLFPSAWHPRAIANELDVSSIEVVKAVIADRMRRRG